MTAPAGSACQLDGQLVGLLVCYKPIVLCVFLDSIRLKRLSAPDNADTNTGVASFKGQMLTRSVSPTVRSAAASALALDPDSYPLCSGSARALQARQIIINQE